MTSNKQAIVYISLGSNIEPPKNLSLAASLLGDVVCIERISSAYITPPQGFTDQNDFWNAAIRAHTDLTPITLKHDVLDVIEKKLNRVRDPKNKNAPRTIDLDISLWNDEVFEYGEKPWHVPDPDILHFAHVAVPLADIAPDYIHPIEKVTLAQIATQYDMNQIRFHKIEDWFEE